jgi:xanthine/uracil/vitamin C permease (AzgA family)
MTLKQALRESLPQVIPLACGAAIPAIVTKSFIPFLFAVPVGYIFVSLVTYVSVKLIERNARKRLENYPK